MILYILYYASILFSVFQLTILGTPAEEGGGGKINMIDANVFDDVDAAMMAHPSPLNEHRYHSLAIERYLAHPIYLLHIYLYTTCTKFF